MDKPILKCFEFYDEHIQHAPIEWKLEFIEKIADKYDINGDRKIDFYNFIKEWAKIEG